METIKLYKTAVDITDWRLDGMTLHLRPRRELRYFVIEVSKELARDIKRTGNPFCEPDIIRAVVKYENHRLFVDYCKEENENFLKRGYPIIYSAVRPCFY